MHLRIAGIRLVVIGFSGGRMARRKRYTEAVMIYLTPEQRSEFEAIADREGIPLGRVIREASLLGFKKRKKRRQ